MWYGDFIGTLTLSVWLLVVSVSMPLWCVRYLLFIAQIIVCVITYFEQGPMYSILKLNIFWAPFSSSSQIVLLFIEISSQFCRSHFSWAEEMCFSGYSYLLLLYRYPHSWFYVTMTTKCPVFKCVIKFLMAGKWEVCDRKVESFALD